jgi:hypothetical protein
MQIHRITYVLLGLVIIVGTIFITTQRGRVQTSPARRKIPPGTEQQSPEETRKHFPTAVFDEPEPSDPQKQIAFRKKKVRHNKGGLVYRNPGPDIGGGGFYPEGQFDFPALPTGLSDAVVLGEVIDAQAHLSEDKSNVYSEFTIRIDNIFKSRGSLAGQITVERIGGWVKYPDGRRLYYELGGANMPRVGGKYLLFLQSIPQTEDFTILTGYELRPAGVAPLDFSGQFEAYRGFSENSLFIDLNSTLAKPPTPPGVN